MAEPQVPPGPAAQRDGTPGSAKKSSSKTVTDTVIGETGRQRGGTDGAAPVETCRRSRLTLPPPKLYLCHPFGPLCRRA